MKTIDASTLRRLAVQADVDPRSLLRLYHGKPVRGSAGHRARRVLIEAGYLKEPATTEHAPTENKK
ncbi:MAG: hypothetical protein IPM35_01775 [Myxococcales bacterium]|nr:hypothetical protein [Myxococcales bacterium]